MSRKTKLELTWIGKDDELRVEPRILLNNFELSYHSQNQITIKDEYENKLIFGDNLLALKSLQSDYSGKLKCIIIDPPYNTGSAFTHYDDGIEHSLWLSMMRNRLELLWTLLSAEGSLWISIDDNEVHYLKVLCDELFGRDRFVASFIWKKVDSPNDNKVAITPDHEYILCYSKTPGARWFKQMKDESILDAYRKPDDESDKPYRDRLLKKNGKNSLRSDRPSMFFPILTPDGEEIYPMHDDGREACWALGKKAVDELIANNKLIWKERIVNGYKQWIPYTREYAPVNPSRPYPTIWNDLNTTRQTKSHHKTLFGETSVFDTPKPEDLIARILDISTERGDIVLDSFAGSGTTGAVAHKMGRRWIMIELGEHCHTHIIPRMKQVIDGTDQGGISKEVNWQGGGGFRYYRLAPSLLEKDKFGNWIINKEYNAPMLAEAMCKHHGFTYAPDDAIYWKQGSSTETDYIYTTTQLVTRELADHIHDQLGENETLLICCKAFNVNAADYPKITFQKIPASILNKCEFGRDDYSLNVAQLPQQEKTEQLELFSEGEER